MRKWILLHRRAGTQHKVQVCIMACEYSEDSNKSVHMHSLISLSFPSKEKLDPWLPIEHRSKTDQTVWMCRQSGKSGTIGELNQVWGVRKMHYA